MIRDGIGYKSFCWSIGTTSFRTKDFNLTIEKQLQLLDSFWKFEENRNQSWTNNNALQEKYYLHLKENNFLVGEAGRKDKDAREKTSGLVDIGLVNEERRLTEVGEHLLRLSLDSDYTSDNSLQIDKDSYIYFKQLLKTSNVVDGKIVRPFITLSYLLCSLEYLTVDEFTYLAPLCCTAEQTITIRNEILKLRENASDVNSIIIDTLMKMDNYQQALAMFVSSQRVDENLICAIGLNRKSRLYDKPYHRLYQELKKMFLDKDYSNVGNVVDAINAVNIKTIWKKYLFSTASSKAITDDPSSCLNTTFFSNINSELDFKIAFFKALHLLKAKATLKDYFDLNRRYFKITDVVLFEDEKVRFDIVPKHYISPVIDELFVSAFEESKLLFKDCPIEEIAPCLAINEKNIVTGIEKELGGKIQNMEEAKQAVLDERLKRFNILIDRKFSDVVLIELLEKFEKRSDDEIRKTVTENADIPTIFEYILGIIWYKISERKGNILEYMNLSLEADLLPKTHAIGGEADIIYQYSECLEYPAHFLLIEATLAEGSNQRRMEMEPVSRHLGEHLLQTSNKNTYCVFSTTYLDRNVISDFRNRKTFTYYNKDFSKGITGLKIIPLQTSTIKEIIRKKLNYKRLYRLFDNAFNSNVPIPSWYSNCIEKEICEYSRETK